MSMTINTKTFTADSFGVNQVTYDGPAKTVTLKDDLSLKYTAPKPTSTYSGVARSASKLTRTGTLTGSLTPSGDSIIGVETSIPVGTAGADIDALVADFAAYAATSEFLALVKQGKISH